jgi:glycosyltransferase involved in cell wall biosynthesis
MSAADAFVMPTLCKEGFPVSVVEAMACGLPAVASRIGGIPTAIDSERTGLLFQTGQVDRLAQALLRLVRDEDLRARLATAARSEAVQRFSVGRMVDDMQTLFERVVAEQPARAR